MQQTGKLRVMRPPGTTNQLQKRREHAIQLLESGQTPAAVARAVVAHRSSVIRWQRAYRKHGAVGLKAKPIPGCPPRLSVQQKEKLVQLLVKGPLAAGYQTELWTLKRIAKLVKTRFGVRYHPSHLWKILNQLGWSCQKPDRRPLQRDEEAIAHWKRYVWPQIKKSGAAGRDPSFS